MLHLYYELKMGVGEAKIDCDKDNKMLEIKIYRL